MSNYLKLQAQIQKLQKEAESVKKRELAETISNIKKAIQIFGLTAADLGLSATGSVKPGRKPIKARVADARTTAGKRRGRPAKKAGADKRSIVAPKYRDSATGITWTGRGKQPKWLSAAISSGKTLEDFKI
ncbi:MAG: H-NS family nucleoid-associated regulatory protein [Burkholderiaceae bacterium]|jgi:DNA-binding protein H-NS